MQHTTHRIYRHFLIRALNPPQYGEHEDLPYEQRPARWQVFSHRFFTLAEARAFIDKLHTITPGD